ncbi:hypothetical protein SASPL_129391 [Salvia splendens]|uniref:Glucose-methanol-choline oxidoreductase N-terminal domain-containing protein n=1 Tax=Salvia splendens TaxID=180675 RepID=A0A8X8ZNP9_SALSN|nr:hypothetical protein SASPL_129391 [Salvia splendens]
MLGGGHRHQRRVLHARGLVESSYEWVESGQRGAAGGRRPKPEDEYSIRMELGIRLLIYWRQRSKKHMVYLNKGNRNEIILSAGAMGSPQLLMLSGIGPAHELKAQGIEVVLDQAMVGQGMCDNPLNGIPWKPPFLKYKINYETETGQRASNDRGKGYMKLQSRDPIMMLGRYMGHKILKQRQRGEEGT